MARIRITHKAGSCRTATDNTGHISHAVINGIALCGAKPGNRSSWSEYDDNEVTCNKCKAALSTAYIALMFAMK